MNEAFVRKRLLIHHGEAFSPQAVETARADLSSIGVFSVVRANPASHWTLKANCRSPST